MAKQITVDTAKALQKDTGARRIIIMFERELGNGMLGFGYVSYGATRALCNSTRELADKLYEAIEGDLGEMMIAEYDRMKKRPVRSHRPDGEPPSSGVRDTRAGQR